MVENSKIWVFGRFALPYSEDDGYGGDWDEGDPTRNYSIEWLQKPETSKTSKSFREVIEEIIRSWKHLKSFNISWIFHTVVISLISRTHQSVLKETKVDFGSGRRTSGCWGLKVDMTMWWEAFWGDFLWSQMCRCLFTECTYLANMQIDLSIQIYDMIYGYLIYETWASWFD